MPEEITIAACADLAEVRSLARFFVNNVTREYISHGELQSARAESRGSWSGSLEDVVADEICKRLNNDLIALVGKAKSRIAAIALIGVTVTPTRYLTLEDLIVADDERGHGIGTAMLAAVEQEAIARDAGTIFLECGMENLSAHGFFSRSGFRPCSITFLKHLG